MVTVQLEDELERLNVATLSDIPALSSATPSPLGTPAPGTSQEASRADHAHALPTASEIGAAQVGNVLPSALSALASAGTNSGASRQDHAHPMPTLQQVVTVGNTVTSPVVFSVTGTQTASRNISQQGLGSWNSSTSGTGSRNTSVGGYGSSNESDFGSGSYNYATSGNGSRNQTDSGIASLNEANTGDASQNLSESGRGSYNQSISNIGSQDYSEEFHASVHEIGEFNSFNITEWRKAGSVVASVQNDGRIQATPGVLPSDVVTVSQLGGASLTNILITNGGVTQGALGSNQTVNMTLTDASHTWSVAPLASKADASALDIVSGNRIRDAVDKNLNIIRVILEVSYTGGGSDGTLSISLVNPSNVVIDQESEGINIDGAGATNQRIAARFFVVKTSDNNVGYTLRISNGAKALTAYRVVSILRNNNP